MSSHLWKTEDVMRFLRVGRNWVYEKVRDGVLPHKRLGPRTIIFTPAEIKKWWKQQPAAKGGKQ